MSTWNTHNQAYNPSVFKGLPKPTKNRGLQWAPIPQDINRDAFCRAVWWVVQIGQSMLETLKTLDLGHGAGPAPPAYRRSRATLAADRALFEFWLNEARKAKGPGTPEARARVGELQAALCAVSEGLNAVHVVLGPRTSTYVVLGLKRVMQDRLKKASKSHDPIEI
jgi:hypothetical protein